MFCFKYQMKLDVIRY